MFNKLVNAINERREELSKIENEIVYSKTMLAEQKDRLIENQKQVENAEKRLQELNKQIANREKFWIETELKYIDNLTGIEFEKYVTNLLNKLDYTAITTKASNDDGVDVIAEKNGKKYAIQCKNYSCPVGNKAVQEVYTAKGITKSDYAIVLTNYPNFTTSAIKEASALEVELWGRDKLTELLYVVFHFDFRNIDNNLIDYSTLNCKTDINEENEDDPFLEEAIEAVIEIGSASTSLIQRKFKVGYARAERIIDRMEEKGIISGYQGSKPREVLMTKERWEDLKHKK